LNPGPYACKETLYHSATAIYIHSPNKFVFQEKYSKSCKKLPIYKL
jgi:hypothetical protein